MFPPCLIPILMAASLSGAADDVDISQSISNDSIVSHAGFPVVLTTPPPPRQYLALKTNIVPWAVTVMNIATEIQISTKVSISLPIMWCPWFFNDRHAIRIIAFQPDVRWWFDTAGIGHYIAPHISIGWYNVKYGDIRYQDNTRPALGGGLTYGYSLNLDKNWNIDFSIGAGFLSLRYDRFYNSINGALIDTRQTSYFGIDHVGISVAYHFSI